MQELIHESPWWLLIAVWFGFFAALSLVSRNAVRRVRTDDRRDELADYASKTLSPIGATFAFLIGFAATMTWSAMSAGQEAVDSQATSAQQLAWATKSISDKNGIAAVIGNLDRYLAVAVAEDPAYLARGDVATLPSAQAFDTLQHSVHSVAYASGTTTPEANAMTLAAAALTAAQAKVSAVAQRSLPVLMTGLLIAAGALLAVAMGGAAAEVSRPYLMYGWALVSAIAVALVLTLDVPFRGAIKVNTEPLAQVSAGLVAEPLNK
ncbi:MAG: hypothetical protein ACR2JI_05345 [Mycobacterium sp.]